MRLGLLPVAHQPGLGIKELPQRLTSNLTIGTIASEASLQMSSTPNSWTLGPTKMVITVRASGKGKWPEWEKKGRAESQQTQSQELRSQIAKTWNKFGIGFEPLVLVEGKWKAYLQDTSEHQTKPPGNIHKHHRPNKNITWSSVAANCLATVSQPKTGS